MLKLIRDWLNLSSLKTDTKVDQAINECTDFVDKTKDNIPTVFNHNLAGIACWWSVALYVALENSFNKKPSTQTLNYVCKKIARRILQKEGIDVNNDIDNFESIKVALADCIFNMHKLWHVCFEKPSQLKLVYVQKSTYRYLKQKLLDPDLDLARSFWLHLDQDQSEAEEVSQAISWFMGYCLGANVSASPLGSDENSASDMSKSEITDWLLEMNPGFAIDVRFEGPEWVGVKNLVGWFVKNYNLVSMSARTGNKTIDNEVCERFDAQAWINNENEPLRITAFSDLDSIFKKVDCYVDNQDNVPFVEITFYPENIYEDHFKLDRFLNQLATWNNMLMAEKFSVYCENLSFAEQIKQVSFLSSRTNFID